MGKPKDGHSCKGRKVDKRDRCRAGQDGKRACLKNCALLQFNFNICLHCALRVGRVLVSVDMAVKVLDESLGKVVLIKLKGGKVIRGVLQGFDQHMNLSLERAEEVNEDGKSNSLGTLIVRGDNIIMISPPPS